MRTPTPRLHVRRQTVIVEYHGRGEWWLMLDDGTVRVLPTAVAAFRCVRRAARSGNKAMTITVIEWRDIPHGFRPPAAGQLMPS